MIFVMTKKMMLIMTKKKGFSFFSFFFSFFSFFLFFLSFFLSFFSLFFFFSQRSLGEGIVGDITIFQPFLISLSSHITFLCFLSIFSLPFFHRVYNQVMSTENQAGQFAQMGGPGGPSVCLFYSLPCFYSALN